MVVAEQERGYRLDKL